MECCLTPKSTLTFTTSIGARVRILVSWPKSYLQNGGSVVSSLLPRGSMLPGGYWVVFNPWSEQRIPRHRRASRQLHPCNRILCRSDALFPRNTPGQPNSAGERHLRMAGPLGVFPIISCGVFGLDCDQVPHPKHHLISSAEVWPRGVSLFSPLNQSTLSPF